MYLRASGNDANGSSRPDIVAVDIAVGTSDIARLEAKLVGNGLAVVTSGRGVGNNTPGSGARLR